jgi:hypothetical protein
MAKLTSTSFPGLSLDPHIRPGDGEIAARHDARAPCCAPADGTAVLVTSNLSRSA